MEWCLDGVIEGYIYRCCGIGLFYVYFVDMIDKIDRYIKVLSLHFYTKDYSIQIIFH